MVASQHFDIVALPHAEPFGCGQCGPDQLCLIIDGFPTGCVDRWLWCDPLSWSLNPADRLEIALEPATGSAPDLEVDDDVGSIEFQDRALLAVNTRCEEESALQELDTACQDPAVP